MRVRREFQLLAAEAASGGYSEPFSLRMLTQILKEDPSYRELHAVDGYFRRRQSHPDRRTGAGVLRTPAPFERDADRLLAVVPLITQPIFLPWWARLFDGSHVVRYRSRQGWAIVLASAAMCAGVFTGTRPLLWVGAVLLGAAQAGANLGWNLGHNDFASIGRAQQYMGVHVTLTGFAVAWRRPSACSRTWASSGASRCGRIRAAAAARHDGRGRHRLQPHARRVRLRNQVHRGHDP